MTGTNRAGTLPGNREEGQTVNTTETVPWLDLSRQYQLLRPEILQTLDQLMGQGSFILGPYVRQFELNFARFLGARHCVGLNSGTSALQLALIACGVGPGDEVITVPATWISTSWAISYVGARPVYVDIDPATYCMDPQRLEAAITPRTRAILPVHLYGQPADMTAINAVAERHGLVVIEDACQAHGASLGGRRAGTFGRVGCFSFYPGKNLGAFGEAGCIVTDDDAVAERIRQLRDHAQASRHVHVEIGYNMRMEGIQAAVLNIKLKHLEPWTERRRQLAQQYDAAWSSIPGLKTPAEGGGTRHARHIYALRCDRRTNLQDYLGRLGILTTVHYPTPLHLQPAYQHLGYRVGDFPETEALFQSQLTMPLFPELTDAEVSRVIEAVRSWASVGPRLRTLGGIIPIFVNG